MSEASFAVVPVIVGARTVLFVLYLSVGAGIFTTGVSGRDLALAASIWRTVPLFIVVVAWINSLCVVVMYIGMLGLFIVASDSELSHLESRVAISRWPRRLGKPELGFLWK